MRLIVATILILIARISCGQEFEYGIFCRENSVGDYSIKSMIILKNDHTFRYEFTGHMISDEAKGTFSVGDDNIVKFRYDTTGMDQNEREAIATAPKVMKYKNDRLYELDEKGRVIKSKRLLSKHRRFYLFGEYSRRKNVFLKRQDTGACK